MAENQYYCFVAGLPDIFFDSTKLPFTVDEFGEMLEEVLANEDKKLVDKYFRAAPRYFPAFFKQREGGH